MIEETQVIAALELDGQTLSFGHGVLVQSAARPHDDWDIFLLDVTSGSLRVIEHESLAAIITGAGKRFTGRVRTDLSAVSNEYARLVSCGALVVT
jgi:hypothetical protein